MKNATFLLALAAVALAAGCAELHFKFADPVKLDTDDYTVALWHFDEGFGAPFDASGRGNNASANSAQWTGGEVEKCLLFEGGGHYVEVPHSESLNFAKKKELSLEAWVCPKKYVRHGTVICKPGQYMLQVHDDGRIACYFYGVSDVNNIQYVFSSNVVPLNKWSYIAATYDGKQIKLYFNGKLDKFIDARGRIEPLLAEREGRLMNYERLPLRIGGDPNLERCWNGMIDEVRISNTVRTPEDIQNGYKRGRF